MTKKLIQNTTILLSPIILFSSLQGLAEENVVTATTDATLSLLTSEETLSNAIFQLGLYFTIAIAGLFMFALITKGYKIYKLSLSQEGGVSLGKNIVRVLKEMTAVTIGLFLMFLAVGAFPMSLSKTIGRIANSFSKPIKK